MSSTPERERRILAALPALHRIAQAANAVLGAQPPTVRDLRTLADALADYESTDAYDAVTDYLGDVA